MHIVVSIDIASGWLEIPGNEDHLHGQMNTKSPTVHDNMMAIQGIGNAGIERGVVMR